MFYDLNVKVIIKLKDVDFYEISTPENWRIVGVN